VYVNPGGHGLPVPPPPLPTPMYRIHV